MKRVPVPKFSNPGKTIIHEANLFDRWMKLFTQQGENGDPTRSVGSQNDFKAFFNQMMPIEIKYTLSKDGIDHVLIINNAKTQLFSARGNLKQVFKKLVLFYANNRPEFFELRYHTKFPKVSADVALEKGLRPPEIIEKEVEKIKEVIVEKEVKIEVPGKTIDLLNDSLGTVQMVIMDLLDGHKKLPNPFRHIKFIEAYAKGDGFIHVNLVLHP